jgi:hypothetical protein
MLSGIQAYGDVTESAPRKFEVVVFRRSKFAVPSRATNLLGRATASCNERQCPIVRMTSNRSIGGRPLAGLAGFRAPLTSNVRQQEPWFALA